MTQDTRSRSPVISVRSAEPSEVDQLARLWYEGWRDAHLAIAPAELVRRRTPKSFRERMGAALPDVRVAGPVGAPVGFHLVIDDELNQLFVAAEARGTGTAAALIADAESRLRDAGVATAWLACAIGNDRAARFYEKQGWRRAGIVVSRLQFADGELALEVWRYEKELRELPNLPRE